MFCETVVGNLNISLEYQLKFMTYSNGKKYWCNYCNDEFFLTQNLFLCRDISKFAMHYIIEEIDEDTSMEDLQKMMVVALIYRLLVCFYEVSY